MSRTLKVPRHEAIEAAMYVFWSKGYNATTVDDLQKAIGIQRGSFYFYFKDKHSLFLEVLDYYRLNVVEKRRELVRQCPSPKKGIELYFKLLVDHLIQNKANSGCLNTNSATELGLSDTEASKKLGLNIQEWKSFWVEILKDADQKSEIRPSLDMVASAHLLIALTQGLNVVARINNNPQFLKSIVKSGLSFLEKDNPAQL